MGNREVRAAYSSMRYQRTRDSLNQRGTDAILPRSSGQRARLALILPLLLILLSLTTLFCGWVFLQRMDRLYRGHIYPNVYALGIDLGGLNPQEAAAALVGVADYVDTGLLVLTDGDTRWSFAWSKAGLQVDVEATARVAYGVGRGGTWRNQAGIWLNYYDVPPRFLFDTMAAQALLEGLNDEVSKPVINPEIELRDGEVVVVPGQTGRVLDVPTTLAKMREVSGSPYRVEVPLTFKTVAPAEIDASAVISQAEALLSRRVTISSYDVLTEEVYAWTLDRDEVGSWLFLVPGADGSPTVDVNQYAIRDTLVQLAAELDDGRGFRYDRAAEKVFQAFDVGETEVELYMTHPESVYTVQAGDTLTSLSARFGMPPGLVAEANRDIDVNHLYVGQQIRIPSQDVLTPHMPVRHKKIVVSIDEQHVWLSEHGQLLYDWPVSTGMEESPTHRGTFQVLEKHEEAYASQWDLWMPYFVSVYPAGGGVENGFHELPILSGGGRLWEGTLGRPASFGCIILGMPAAETLYEWADIGTVVEIR